jgi:hypothetical protein
MKKIFIGYHPAWNIKAEGYSKAEVISKIGCEESELTFQELSKTDYLLSKVPPEFRSKLSYMAYEKGHSAGEEEIELILEELINDLLPCIESFEKRLTIK